MCARSTAEYDEELWGPKEEKKPQRQLLDAVFNLRPQNVLHRADIHENLHTKRQEPEPLHIKEEPEDKEVHHIKKEDKMILIKKEVEEVQPHIKQEGGDIATFPLTGVPLKCEDGGESVESGWAQLPSSSSSQCITAEDGDHNGASHPDGLLGPLSDCDDITSDPRDTDERQYESDFTCHTKNKEWKISQSRRTFAYKSIMKRYVKIQIRQKDFACSVCGQSFSRTDSLKMHTRTHPDEMPFSCVVCSQRFTQEGDLKEHTRTHTGEKPFSCLVCGQRFSKKGTLKIHTRRHTGEKPYCCSFCGQRFSHQGNLKTHTRTHTGEKPFSCLVCGQRFIQKGNLNRHTRTHTSNKPFSCSVCGQRFTRKDYLKRHTTTHW
ncbi:gastrula zinc finger protein xFG20-1-like isoform X2 [Syngnathoides biaculeatus]|nr:gastrula zinc finger protein xFG20-1-like isoform X2 [Syngnathoides biaculeatus]XP_061662796.1 gastrula zinc finger protein xFG20-1-like isoform X2 [Syngnathoides biaculeatus]